MEDLLWKRLWAFCKTDCAMNWLRSLYLYDTFAQTIRKNKLENDLDMQVKVPFQYVLGGRGENYEHFRIADLQVELRILDQLPNAIRCKLFEFYV